MSIKGSQKRKALRAAKAKERQEQRNSLTNKQQLAKLDAMLGKGVGAKKERKRLAST